MEGPSPALAWSTATPASGEGDGGSASGCCEEPTQNRGISSSPTIWDIQAVPSTSSVKSGEALPQHFWGHTETPKRIWQKLTPSLKKTQNLLLWGPAQGCLSDSILPGLPQPFPMHLPLSSSNLELAKTKRRKRKKSL